MSASGECVTLSGWVAQMSELKIFQVCCDFIVAESAEAAEKFYIAMVGESDPSVKEMDTEEVPREDWASMKIVDVDEPGHPTKTFQEAFDDMLTWKNQEYPKVIASTEI